MKAFAAWRVEKGIRVITLEQLLGSRAIGSTLLTLINLNAYNLLGLLLILLWGLSPLGGQASLRTPSLEWSNSASPATFSYFDWKTLYQVQGANAIDTYRPIWTSIYTTGLTGSATAKRSSQDVWGNVKVPAIEAVTGYNKSITDQWLPIYNSGDTVYSSLLGLPMSPPVTALNTSYNLDTSYMTLTCGDTRMISQPQGNLTQAVIEAPPEWLIAEGNHQYQIATENDAERQKTRFSEPRHIYFQSWSGDSDDSGNLNKAVTKCNLTTSYVELNVSCVEKVCSTIAIRPSQVAHNPVTWSVLDGSSGMIGLSFFGDFVNATETLHIFISSATEYYLVEPDHPYDPRLMISYADFSTVNAKDFATRYTQLFNSYYSSQVATFAMTGSVLPSDNNSMAAYNYTNTTGSVQSAHRIIVCHQGWLSMLLLASLVMTLCGIASAILCILRRGPDILDSFSSFTRDNEFVANSVPAGGSNMDGMSRARHLKNVEVKLGDVAPDQDVGHISVGAVGTQKIGSLKNGRFYD